MECKRHSCLPKKNQRVLGARIECLSYLEECRLAYGLFGEWYIQWQDRPKRAQEHGMSLYVDVFGDQRAVMLLGTAIKIVVGADGQQKRRRWTTQWCGHGVRRGKRMG